MRYHHRLISKNLWKALPVRAAASSSLGSCGLPKHLCREDGPNVRDLAWFARQAYNSASELRPPIASKGWNYLLDESHSIPSEGVHIHTWKRSSDVVIACRGTTWDEIAHVVGAVSLFNSSLRSSSSVMPQAIENQLHEQMLQWGIKGLKGAGTATRLVQEAIAAHDGCRVWLTGHSRGAALQEYVGLSCAEQIEAVVSFESPGLPRWIVDKGTPDHSKFVHFFTYPNWINLLNQSINPWQRYHIPAKLSYEATTWDFVQQCVMADASRCLNWASLALPLTRAFGLAANSAGTEIKALQLAKLVPLWATTSGSSPLMYLRGLGWLSSLKLCTDDVLLAHSMDGIIEQLFHAGGAAAIVPISRWPSDEEDLLTQANAKLLQRHIAQFLRDQFLFGQVDLPGIHHLVQEDMGREAMFQARMHRLWGPRWELGSSGEVTRRMSPN